MWTDEGKSTLKQHFPHSYSCRAGCYSERVGRMQDIGPPPEQVPPGHFPSQDKRPPDIRPQVNTKWNVYPKKLAEVMVSNTQQQQEVASSTSLLQLRAQGGCYRRGRSTMTRLNLIRHQDAAKIAHDEISNLSEAIQYFVIKMNSLSLSETSEIGYRQHRIQIIKGPKLSPGPQSWTTF